MRQRTDICPEASFVAVALANEIGSEAGTEDSVLDAICRHALSSAGGG